jgi:hypothetical protein
MSAKPETGNLIPNGLAPQHMSPAERHAEIGRILAAGLRRMWTDKSTHLSPENRDSFVDILALKRRCVGRKPRNRVGGR